MTAAVRGTPGANGTAHSQGTVRARWRRDADVVVVGSGAAGIAAALTAAASGLRVLMVTKDLVGGATAWAQGGLAAAIGPADSAAAHARDTEAAGAGLCEPEVVAALAAGAPGAISWLTALGARLETRELRLEGGHGQHRIVHSGDDATGAEVHRVLLAALLASGIEILDRTVAIDLIGPGTSPAGGRAAGLTAAVIKADGRLAPGIIAARAVVIAAGGLGQAFATTSNPAGATGDGIALAARAGAVLRDLEFVQFHPTVLWLPGASGQCPLITEALRGAGAVLRDTAGEPLMAGHHPRGDLAPRDVVAARMAEVIAAGTAGHVWLDATGLGPDLLENGFPTVTAACRKHGIDPVTAFIPVAPGAHYSCGGIRADFDGRTSIPGLYAVGEAASTGVQGANRLASNSVTEAIIAGRRAGGAVREDALNEGIFASDMTTGVIFASEITTSAGVLPLMSVRNRCKDAPGRRELAAAMSRNAGVLRDAEGLTSLATLVSSALPDSVVSLASLDSPTSVDSLASVNSLASLASRACGADVAGGEPAGPVPAEKDADLDLGALEAANLRIVSALIAAGALRRAESRGCHRRRDATRTAERAWHTLLRWDGQELLVTEEKL